MKPIIDLRSDTVTQPTQQMRDAMYNAVVGDDIMRADPTVIELEKKSAAMLGKEEGLFLASGTMANQVAVMTFTNRGDEIIVGDTSHIYNLEVGALAALCQVQTRVMGTSKGYYDAEEIRSLIREKGIQNAHTGLICLENSMNLNAGLAVSAENINKVAALAKEHSIPLYMDGARLFNAAEALGADPAVLTKNVDAVMFALTKGLSAPFGAVLCGTSEFIEKARWIKQRIGGGFRQAGFMAAPAITALDTMISRLKDDRENAKLLGSLLEKIEGITIDTSKIHTNIVTASVEKLGISIEEFLNLLDEKGVKAKRISAASFRMVAHYGVESEDIEYTAHCVSQIADKFRN